MKATIMVLAAILVLTLASAPKAAQPRAAPQEFVTEQYGLTFHTPVGSTYCPLPPSWTGSDHGTELYLEPPISCGGAGYPSSGRAYRAKRDPRQIDVFYAYWDSEDRWRPAHCDVVGKVQLFGKQQSLCTSRWRRFQKIEVVSTYKSDTDAQVTFSLLTDPKHLATDLKTFAAILRSVQTCSAEWHNKDLKGKPTGKSFVTGTGPRCPKGAKWF